jgi:hypothetical protein
MYRQPLRRKGREGCTKCKKSGKKFQELYITRMIKLINMRRTAPLSKIGQDETTARTVEREQTNEWKIYFQRVPTLAELEEKTEPTWVPVITLEIGTGREDGT